MSSAKREIERQLEENDRERVLQRCQQVGFDDFRDTYPSATIAKLLPGHITPEGVVEMVDYEQRIIYLHPEAL
jgi:hypothetical protein